LLTGSPVLTGRAVLRVLAGLRAVLRVLARLGAVLGILAGLRAVLGILAPGVRHLLGTLRPTGSLLRSGRLLLVGLSLTPAGGLTADGRILRSRALPRAAGLTAEARRRLMWLLRIGATGPWNLSVVRHRDRPFPRQYCTGG